MSNDLVKWLREASSRHNNYRCDEAADRIEKLQEQNTIYFHAFNKAADHIETLEAALREMISLKDKRSARYKRARAALEGKDES